jgi:hypothetical protein
MNRLDLLLNTFLLSTLAYAYVVLSAAHDAPVREVVNSIVAGV